MILEAIKAGLQTPDPATIPGRRTRMVHFSLPSEIRERAKQLTGERNVSQQSLIRHFLFAHVSRLGRKAGSALKPAESTLRMEEEGAEA
jgi:hypothetical protein